ncbi:ATP-binding protein [Desulfofundulus salinus]|uniref:ATP-binding protein n=1 Tax=Desulfofundulus salinus TaxID=2419843 RepID=A0A494WZV1_9FIRM|nr:ATP-binding protein [Desulfofundulus salinum]
MVFVNRKTELNWLEEAYRSSRAQLLVLYGRRRVGKTELLRGFCREKRHVFLLPHFSGCRMCIKAGSHCYWQRPGCRFWVAPQGSISPVAAAASRSFPGRLPPAGHSRPAGGGNGAGIPTPGSLHGRGTVY